MQIILACTTLAIIAAVIAIYSAGVATVERKAARWLLRDASGWDARAEEKRRATVELAEVR